MVGLWSHDPPSQLPFNRTPPSHLTSRVTSHPNSLTTFQSSILPHQQATMVCHSIPRSFDLLSSFPAKHESDDGQPRLTWVPSDFLATSLPPYRRTRLANARRTQERRNPERSPCQLRYIHELDAARGGTDESRRRAFLEVERGLC